MLIFQVYLQQKAELRCQQGRYDDAERYLLLALEEQSLNKEQQRELENDLLEVKKTIAQGTERILQERLQEIQLLSKETEHTRGPQTDAEKQNLKELQEKLMKDQKDLQVRIQEVATEKSLVVKELDRQKEESKRLVKIHRDFAEQSAKNSVDTEDFQRRCDAIRSSMEHVEAARKELEAQLRGVQRLQEELAKREKLFHDSIELFQLQQEHARMNQLTEKERAYQRHLKATKRMHRAIGRVRAPICFISYAWESNENDRSALQNRLLQLKEDLEMAGIEVWFDLTDMSGRIEDYMNRIRDADKFLLICTPQLKTRASQPGDNNLKYELKQAIERNQTKEFIVPLIFDGDLKSSVPEEVMQMLAISFSGKESYHNAMVGLVPLGLIPQLLNMRKEKLYQYFLMNLVPHYRIGLC